MADSCFFKSLQRIKSKNWNFFFKKKEKLVLGQSQGQGQDKSISCQLREYSVVMKDTIN